MKRLLLLISVGAWFALSFGTNAQAASVTFTSPVGLLLTSPTTTLTIASGSVADLVTVNATSVMVTLTSGEVFTLESPSYDLSVSSSTGGGSTAGACTNGLMTEALSQTTGSTIYTVIPIGTLCSSASAPIISSIIASGVTASSAIITWTTNVTADSEVSYGTTTSYGATSTDPTLVTSHSLLLSGLSQATTYHFAVYSSENGTSTTSGDTAFTTIAVSTSGGGGGGGGTVEVSSQYGSPYPTSTGNAVSTSIQSPPLSVETSSLEAELNALLAELAALEAQAGKASSATHFTFTGNLSLGSTGSDVTQLQDFLIAQASGPAAARLKAHGVTKNFATLTFNALVEFQKSAGIKPASGFFGPKTRAYANAAEK